jgi:sporulation protein YabP
MNDHTSHVKRPRHEIVMINRRSLAISGVKNVESFDSEEFLLETDGGFLTIRGQNLHMKNLSLETGEVAIEGLVHEMAYLEQGHAGDRSKGFFGKLFK